MFGNFYFVPQTSYGNLEQNPVPSFFNVLQSLEKIAIYFNKNIKKLESLVTNLAVQPNHEKKIFLSRVEYKLWDQHVEHFDHFDQQMGLDQQMGARHSILGNKDVKIMKNCTIVPYYLQL